MADPVPYTTQPGAPAPMQPNQGTLGTVGAVVNLAQKVYDFFSNIGGGGVSYTSCPGQWPADQVAFALANASAAELQSLRDSHAKTGNAFPSDPADLAFSAVGGTDCKITSEAGRQWAGSFNLFMDAKLKQLGATPYAPGTTPPTSTTDNLAPNANLGDEIDKTWEAIKKTFGNILTSTATGAATGARTASQGAATGSGLGSFGTLLPWLAIGAVGTIIFLAVRRK